MSNVIRISPRVTTSSAASSEKSESSPQPSIAFFCGIGLLVSVLAILLGIPGLWH